jgi:predicted RNA binding protein YcfA (HicA-like mRNA interferase family)
MSIKKRIRAIRELGWAVEYTSSNHLRLTHPHAQNPVFASVSPSDRRAWQQMLADMRRALRPEAGTMSRTSASALKEFKHS